MPHDGLLCCLCGRSCDCCSDGRVGGGGGGMSSSVPLISLSSLGFSDTCEGIVGR